MTNMTNYYEFFSQDIDYEIPTKLLTLLAFVIVLVFINIGSILIILTSSKLRSMPIYLIAANLNLVFIIQSLLLLIIIVSSYYKDVDYDFCNLNYHQVLIGIICVSLIGTFCSAMNTAYITEMKYPSSFESNKQYFVLAIVVIFCYFVNIVVLTPVYTKFVDKTKYVHNSEMICSYRILDSVHESILLVLANIPQYFWLVISMVMSLIYYARYKLCRRSSKPTDLAFSSLAVLSLCFVPIIIRFRCIDTGGKPESLCDTEGIWQVILYFLPFTCGIVVPFIWMLNVTFRHAVRDFLTCKCCKPSLSSSYELV